MNDKNVKRACVMGWPVSYSLSPHLHTYWLEKYGIDGVYGAMAVMPEYLKDALHRIADQGYAGCNLTMPLKQAALPFMDIHDESCLMSGAVNTISFANGKIKGFNSDGFGFMENLKEQMSAWDASRVAILGSGGGACGVIASLQAAGAKHFVIISRKPERPEKMVKNFKITADILPWDERHAALKDVTMLINCTSLGMVDQDSLEIDLSLLPKTAAVCDIVYQPVMTPLLTTARKRGNPVIDGLGMLMHQGRLGFDYWFGRDPEVTPALRTYMEELNT